MDFAQIAQLTDKCADTRAYTTDDATHIYSLIKDTFNLTASSPKTEQQLLRQLHYLLKRESNQRLHAATLAQYHQAKRIPRGLRVSLKPT